MSAPHTAVKHELLVRYLDAWTPAALRGHRKVIFLGYGSVDSALAAVRVFVEFADHLGGRAVSVLVASPSPNDLASVSKAAAGIDGISVEALAGDIPNLGSAAVFGYFDGQAPAAVMSAVVKHKAGEVLLFLPEGEELSTLPSTLQCRADLVDAGGKAESLIFATSTEKALEKFKDELWALDEYAGIRLRDPGDAEHALLDITEQPNLGPLRRLLTHHLAAAGGCSFASLRSWAVQHTVYRAADAQRATQALLTSGTFTREPPTGRLSPDSMVYAASAHE